MEMDPLMHFALLSLIAIIWFILALVWEWFRKTPMFAYLHKMVGRIVEKS